MEIKAVILGPEQSNGLIEYHNRDHEPSISAVSISDKRCLTPCQTPALRDSAVEKDSLRNRLYCSDMRFRPLLGVLFGLFLSLPAIFATIKVRPMQNFDPSTDPTTIAIPCQRPRLSVMEPLHCGGVSETVGLTWGQKQYIYRMS